MGDRRGERLLQLCLEGTGHVREGSVMVSAGGVHQSRKAPRIDKVTTGAFELLGEHRKGVHGACSSCPSAESGQEERVRWNRARQSSFN